MRFVRFAVLVFSATAAFAAPVFAAGVNVAPTRVVLDARARTSSLTLFNADPSAEVTYRIELIDQFMGADGAVRPLAEGAAVPAGWRSARAFLQISPSQVRLGPGRSQTIRIAARPPEGLEPAEYRAHLSISALPPITAPVSPTSSRQLSVSVQSIFAVSVPVIVRLGATPSAPVLEGGVLQDKGAGGGPAFVFDLKRTGASSVFGDVVVSYAPPDGRAEDIGAITRIAAYPEVRVRQVAVPVRAPRGGFQSGGRNLARMYADRSDPKPLAEPAYTAP
jgi:hypothetical protein